MTASFVDAFLTWTATPTARYLSLALLAVAIPGLVLTKDHARPHWAFSLAWVVGAVLALSNNALPNLFGG